MLIGMQTRTGHFVRTSSQLLACACARAASRERARARIVPRNHAHARMHAYASARTARAESRARAGAPTLTRHTHATHTHTHATHTHTHATGASNHRRHDSGRHGSPPPPRRRPPRPPRPPTRAPASRCPCLRRRIFRPATAARDFPRRHAPRRRIHLDRGRRRARQPAGTDSGNMTRIKDSDGRPRGLPAVSALPQCPFIRQRRPGPLDSMPFHESRAHPGGTRGSRGCDGLRTEPIQFFRVAGPGAGPDSAESARALSCRDPQQDEPEDSDWAHAAAEPCQLTRKASGDLICAFQLSSESPVSCRSSLHRHPSQEFASDARLLQPECLAANCTGCWHCRALQSLGRADLSGCGTAALWARPAQVIPSQQVSCCRVRLSSHSVQRCNLGHARHAHADPRQQCLAVPKGAVTVIYRAVIVSIVLLVSILLPDTQPHTAHAGWAGPWSLPGACSIENPTLCTIFGGLGYPTDIHEITFQTTWQRYPR